MSFEEQKALRDQAIANVQEAIRGLKAVGWSHELWLKVDDEVVYVTTNQKAGQAASEIVFQEFQAGQAA